MVNGKKNSWWIFELGTLIDNITYEVVYHLEIDYTQIANLDFLMKTKDISLEPLYFYKTSSSIEVGYDFPIYPPIPSD